MRGAEGAPCFLFAVICLPQADDADAAKAGRPGEDVEPVADVARCDDPRLSVIGSCVCLMGCGGPVKAVQRGEVDAVLVQVVLAFGLVPVPHLYAYIKLPGKGECGVGRVKVGLREEQGRAFRSSMVRSVSIIRVHSGVNVEILQTAGTLFLRLVV